MTKDKMYGIPKQEEILELDDDQLEQVSGGLAAPRIGTSISLSKGDFGKKLPNDTGFGK